MHSQMKYAKSIYCFTWSIGLLFSTFYVLFCGEEEAFGFSDKLLLPVAQSYIMPMILVMSLYLWDVLYNFVMHPKSRDTDMFWIILCMIGFLVLFVFSILVNNNNVGWVLFIMSWVTLTVLKYKTTADTHTQIFKIPED